MGDPGRHLRTLAWASQRAVVLLVLGVTAVAQAAPPGAPRIHALIIGNNQPPAPAIEVATQGGSTLPTLRFADDDAAAFYDLLKEVAEDVHLLTIMDRDTQTLYPRVASLARAPSVKEVRAAVAGIAVQLERDRRDGYPSVLFIFFSGHGSIAEAMSPALALLDGGITQQFLYDEILEHLPADVVHLLVDACHAEAVVRPREAGTTLVPVAPTDAQALLVRSTLARFPHAGAIVAASSNAPAHEWDALRHGVFTHELLSGMRGAADVNHDGRIEYSELYAFLGAANRKVSDPRARLAIVARPPDADRRSVLWDLNRLGNQGVIRLNGVPGGAGLVRIEDASGRLLASSHGEPGFAVDLSLPARETLYVRAATREARLEAVPGTTLTFDRLAFSQPGERARGSLEDALERGLFASTYGPAYYNGFIDQTPEFVPVTFARGRSTTGPSVDSGANMVSLSAAATDANTHPPQGRLLVGFGASRPVAAQFNATPGLRLGFRPGRAGGGFLGSLDLFRTWGAGVSESRFMVSAGWLVMRCRDQVSAWAGGVLGGGAVSQEVAGQSTRSSGLLAAAPVAGAALNLPRGFAAWLEGELPVLAMRLDGGTAFTLAPTVWLGLLVGL